MLTERAIWFVRAVDSERPDVVGWGECGPMPGLSRDDRPDFAAAIAQFVAAANAGTPLESLALDALPSFAFGLEIALRDLAMGGRRLLWDTPFARGEAGLATHGLIWMDTADGLLRQIEAKIAAGFRVIKMKVGALPFADELALLRTVRQAYPASQIELRLDANGAWSPVEAAVYLDRLAPLEIAFLEQPIAAGQWEALAALCRHSPIPLALDEELLAAVSDDERAALLETIRPQHLILKPMLLGGFAACEQWIALAEARGIQWWVNSLLESNIGLNAICQWTSAIDPHRIHGLGTGTLFRNNVRLGIEVRGNEVWRKWRVLIADQM